MGMVNTTYGEITKEGIRVFYNYCTKEGAGQHFIDLGSGKGNSLLYFKARYPRVETVTGIEYLQERHQEAVDNLRKSFKDAPEPTSSVEYHYDVFSLYCGNIFEERFRDTINRATLVYVSNLCFSKEDNDKISTILKNTKGVVISSKELSVENSTETSLKQTWCDTGEGHIWIRGGGKTRRNKRKRFSSKHSKKR